VKPRQIRIQPVTGGEARAVETRAVETAPAVEPGTPDESPTA